MCVWVYACVCFLFSGLAFVFFLVSFVFVARGAVARGEDWFDGIRPVGTHFALHGLSSFRSSTFSLSVPPTFAVTPSAQKTEICAKTGKRPRLCTTKISKKGGVRAERRRSEGGAVAQGRRERVILGGRCRAALGGSIRPQVCGRGPSCSLSSSRAFFGGGEGSERTSPLRLPRVSSFLPFSFRFSRCS